MKYPVILVLIGIASVQVGAAIAKTLFDEASPTTLVWLRLFFTAAILLLIARPRWRGRTRHDWMVVIVFGLVLATMNWSIYQAFARIPLGIAVTIEFIGPLTVALLGSRRRSDLVWVALAAAGVLLLGFEPGDVTLAGVLFALLAGVCWGAYILLSQSTGAQWTGLSGLATASLIGVIALTPLQLATNADELMSWRLVAIGAVIAVMSSTIPYSLELIALRSLSTSIVGILMSLEPAVAAFAGLLLLSEMLSLVQWLAISCVVIASIGATRAGQRPSGPVAVE